MTTQVKNEQKKLNAAISGKLAHDSRALEQVFEACRTDDKKMTLLIRAFCESYLIDQHRRPLKLRPLQEQIVLKCLIIFLSIFLTSFILFFDTFFGHF